MGPLMLDLTGYEVTGDEKEILDHPLVGGIILFTRNYHDVEQLAELVRQCRQASRNDILIAVDHEGGRVQRFRDGFSRIPAMGELYSRASGDLDMASDFAKQFGWLMAAELMALDIDLSFSPVLDIQGNSQVIGDRSFHQKPEVIIQLGCQWIEGMHRAGMKATGKHFPGHGNVLEDSHVAMPVDERSKDEIFNYDMRIFKAIHEKGLLDAVMPAHVVYPKVDKQPTGFSRVWIRDILRKQLNFDGVVFSDDLSMKGATGIKDFGDRARAALDAGCDMALVCNDRDGAIKVLDTLPITYEGSERLLRMKTPADYDGPKSMQELRSGYLWKQCEQMLSEFYAD